MSAICPAEKVLDRLAFIAARERLRLAGARVVFTNGCFDLLHRAHTEYLQEAATLGDALFVGVNDDAAVRALKGPGRPVMPAADRAALLAALQCVDRVCIFPEISVATLVSQLLPDVLVKGGDYRPDQVVGRECVEAHGGQVRVVAFWPGCSTSGLIRRIRELPP